MKNFSSYYEARCDANLNSMVDQLCENIAQSDISFDEFWAEHALPVLLEGNYRSEEELVEQFMDKVRGFLGGGERTPRPQTRPSFAGPTPEPQAQPGGKPFGAERAAQTGQQLQAGADRRQNKLNKESGQIRKEFKQAMHGFMKSVNDRLMQRKDPMAKYAYQMAQMLNNKMTKHIDNWQPGHKRRDPMAEPNPALAKFAKGQAAYNQQAGRDVGPTGAAAAPVPGSALSGVQPGTV